MAGEKPMADVAGTVATGRRAAPPLRFNNAMQRGPRAQRLAQAIETTIVPRLLLARPVASIAAGTSPIDVTTLAALALQSEDAAADFVQERHAAGLPLEAIYTDLLAPAVRQLGEAWDADTADFTEVAIGTFRLQRLLRHLATDYRPQAHRCDPRRTILLAPAPGEKHVFAVALLAEVFRHAGWLVEVPLDATADDLARLVAREHFSVLGLSVSGDDRMEGLAKTIRTLRRASVHRALGIMVGGPVFNAHPDYVTLVGADAMAVDARQATRQAETLLGLVAAAPA